MNTVLDTVNYTGLQRKLLWCSARSKGFSAQILNRLPSISAVRRVVGVPLRILRIVEGNLSSGPSWIPTALENIQQSGELPIVVTYTSQYKGQFQCLLIEYTRQHAPRWTHCVLSSAGQVFRGSAVMLVESQIENGRLGGKRPKRPHTNRSNQRNR